MKSDSQLQEDVISVLKGCPHPPASDIGVSVRCGVVELSGNVRSHADKLSVEKAVQAVAGVKALAVDLRVISPGHEGDDDVEIARCVELGLTWKNGVTPHALRVMVENGTVTLTGDVESDQEKQAALDSIRYLRGVIAVVEEIAVKPKVVAGVVRGEIEAGLRRSATTEAANISMSVDGDQVTLTGVVHSRHDGQNVVKSVEESRGVRHVVDNLTIAK